MCSCNFESNSDQLYGEQSWTINWNSVLFFQPGEWVGRVLSIPKFRVYRTLNQTHHHSRKGKDLSHGAAGFQPTNSICWPRCPKQDLICSLILLFVGPSAACHSPGTACTVSKGTCPKPTIAIHYPWHMFLWKCQVDGSYSDHEGEFFSGK